MRNRTKNLVIGLAIFTVVTLSLGKFFDTRCVSSCIGEAFAANSKDGLKGLEKYDIHLEFNDEHKTQIAENAEDHSFTINLGGEDSDIGGDESNPKRIKESLTESFAAKGLKEIVIRSYVTDWSIALSKDDKAHVSFKGYLLPKEWTTKESTGKLSIELNKKGPNEGELQLPKDFSGKLVFVSVSGDLSVVDLGQVSELEISIVSGDVHIQSAPSKELMVNTVSGDVKLNPATLNKDLKIRYHSVSGDLDSVVRSSIKAFIAKTVSGDVALSVGKTVGFDFEMEGISASFEGLPQGTQKLDDIAHQGAKGSFGKDPKGELNFNSVSGDFDLKQAE